MGWRRGKPLPEVWIDAEQGRVYADFIAGELAVERSRSNSLGERGARLQTSTSLAVGLFTTAMGFLIGGVRPPSGPSLWLFVAAVVVLVAAFLFAIVVTRGAMSSLADERTLMKMTDEKWGDNQVNARGIVARINTNSVRKLRSSNDTRSWQLDWALGLQAAGILLAMTAFVVTAVALRP